MTLSDRELEIALLVSQAMSNKQIEDHLCISPKTVETHLSNIYAKLNKNGHHSRVAVARWIWKTHPHQFKVEKREGEIVIRVKVE